MILPPKKITATPVFNSELVNILDLLLQANQSTIAGNLKVKKGSYTLLSGPTVLVEINKDSVRLLGQYELDAKLIADKPSAQVVRFEKEQLKAFFEALSPDVVRLNHMGLSYSPKDSDEDIEKYRSLLKNTSLHLYREPSESQYEQWFFVGDRTKWENPLFELVMNSTDSPYAEYWVPHFQIDIDTKLNIEQLEELTDKYLEKGFFKWKFDIKNYGVVLGTGRLANIHGTKIYLALGTSLRGTEWHRREGLKDF